MMLPIDSGTVGQFSSINVYKRAYADGWQWSVWIKGAGTVGVASTEAQAWRKARAVAAQSTAVDPKRRIIP